MKALLFVGTVACQKTGNIRKFTAAGTHARACFSFDGKKPVFIADWR